MKLSCDVIRDLLPLYADRAASADTAALVEEHLASCPACAAKRAAMGAEEGPSPEEAAETARLISAFLRRQGELDRKLFVRRYFYLESLADLGARFGLTQGQVKSRLHRVRQRLRAELEREGVPV